MKITDIMNGRIIRIRLYGYSEGEKMFQTYVIKDRQIKKEISLEYNFTLKITLKTVQRPLFKITGLGFSLGIDIV